ncbi:MAG: hypothetical protein QXI54_06425 [Archaeoglobaceae archaeon]
MKIWFFLLLISSILLPISAWSIPFSIDKTDGGYIIAGTIYSGYKRPFIMKIDRDGELLWDKVYSTNYDLQAWSVVRTASGYAIGGVIGNSVVGDKGLIIKVNYNGRPLWQKIYGYDGCISGVPALVSENDSIVASISMPLSIDNCSHQSLLIVKLDKDGNEVWKRIFDYRDYNSVKMIKKSGDGGFIGAGCIGDYVNGLYRNYDLLILKLDNDGNEEWSKILDLGFDEVAWDVAEVKDGYIIVGGTFPELSCRCSSVSNYTAKAFAIKLDLKGNIEWKKFFEVGKITSAWSVLCNPEPKIFGTAIDEEGYYLWFSEINGSPKIIEGDFRFLPAIYGLVRVLEDDGYLLTSSGCKGECIWLGKMSKNGELIWEKSYKPNAIFDISSIFETQASENKFQESNEGISPLQDDREHKKSFTISKELLYAVLLIFLALILAFGVSRFGSGREKL